MLPDLDTKIQELRQKRKQKGMTQTALAERAGVSQSFIAKLESGKASPGYEKIHQVESALTDAHLVAEKCIEDPIVCQPTTEADDAVEKVIKNGYVVVVQKSMQRGAILPPQLLSYDFKDLAGRTAEDIMGESLPHVSPPIEESALRSLLSTSPVIAVVEEESMKGVITRSGALEQLMEDI